MNDEDFRKLCNTYGFAPSRALREMLDAVTKQERDKYEAKFKQLEAIMQVREQQPNKPCCLAEREACAKVCDDLNFVDNGTPAGTRASNRHCAAAIRARGQE